MAKVTKVSVTISKTIQVVQFEPVTVAITREAELEKGDDPAEVEAELQESIGKSVKKLMKEERNRWVKKSKE